MQLLKQMPMHQQSRRDTAMPSRTKTSLGSSATPNKLQRFLRLCSKTIVTSSLRTFFAYPHVALQRLIHGLAVRTHNITEEIRARLVSRRSTIALTAHLYDSRAVGESPPSIGNFRKRCCDKCLRRPQSITAIAIITTTVCRTGQG